MKAAPQTLEALEFPFVRQLLADRTVTPLGTPLASAVGPLQDDAAVRESLDETDETVRLLEAEGEMPLRGMEPVEEILASLGPQGTVLTGREILSALRFCEVVEAVRARLPRLRPDYPMLAARAEPLPDLRQIVRSISGKIAPSGELEDSASPELGKLRARIQATSGTLRSRLEAILSRSGGETVFSDHYVTERGGRFVVPVRSDAPVRLKGIVHGGSSSGATLFVEPLATVELNNDLVRLREEEVAEIERILRDWTERLRARLDDLLRAAAIVARLDLAQARARLARDIGGVRPAMGEGKGFALAAGRHPLLEKTLALRGARMVPVDVAIPPGTSTLIVSGPNAGGKTVVLKTAGLIALMAHAGLHVPAQEAHLPWLRQVLVDIGDRQSIEGSLSTFSAHIQNLSQIVSRIEPPALVLIDEIGTGTDPVEGGALAIALLEKLRAAGALTIATTHHGPVKLYGIETPEVASAAVEFDEASLAPTFRLLQGMAGASAGLAIAERLGLDPAIVADARRRIAPGEREAESYLLRLRSLVSDLEEDRKELERSRARLAEEARRAREEAIRSDHERAERFRGELNAALEEFRTAAREQAKGLVEKKDAMRLDKDRARRETELRREFERISKLAGIGGKTPASRTTAPFEVAPGATVLVGPYEREGRVESIAGDMVTVLVGGARFRVRRDECHPPGGPEAGRTVQASGRRRTQSEETGSPEAVRELNIIGLTVEEGLEVLDKFLDDAVRAGLGEVRVIHGHGTGRLRTGVRNLLSRHTHVASHRPGEPHEGGNGATIVLLQT